MLHEEKLEALRSITTGLNCAKCGPLTCVDAIAEYSGDDCEAKTDVEVRCPRCHSTLLKVEFNGPIIDAGGDDE